MIKAEDRDLQETITAVCFSLVLLLAGMAIAYHVAMRIGGAE